MAIFTYQGPEPSLDVSGQLFNQNEPTTVSDAAVIKAVRAYEPKEHFTETKPAPDPDAQPTYRPKPQDPA